MAPAVFKTVYLLVALVALPQVLAGPGCARRHYGKPDCVTKCKSRWGTNGNSMGQNKWGPVVNNTKGQDSDLDNTISTACGLNKTTNPNPEPTTTNSPDSNDSPDSPDSPGCTKSSPIPSSNLPPVNNTSPGPTSPTPPPPDNNRTPTHTPKTPLPTTTPDDNPPQTPTPTDKTPPASPSPTPGDLDASPIEAEALKDHNDFRALHGAKPLTWNNTLADAAKTWASRCVFEHSGGKVGPYGENLAAGSGSGFTTTDGINAWNAEAKDYNPQDHIYSHFTQVVWKSTTQLGCALVTCGPGTIFSGSSNFLVCEYDPAGNVEGQFADNVQP